MDLSSNGFSGNLPARLFENFQAMKIIDENVRDPWNRFEGYIPSIIGDLAALHTLNLSHNRLEGRIPPSLHQLSVLESLDLSFNKIGRGIPQQLAFLTSLEVLNLSHNHLVGCISKGKQFDTFELHEEEEEEDDSPMISWQAVLMGYGCGFIKTHTHLVGLNESVVYEEHDATSGLLHCLPSAALPHLCSEDQALALLQFKHMFTINPDVSCFNPTSLSWNKSTDCCSWDGVRCEETTRQVIELYLSYSGLQGKFHPNNSLFQLSNLERLDLSYNDFSGYLISPKFGELSSLAHLDLSRSSFTGIIPAEISHLSKLYVLRIWTFDPYGLRLGHYNFELLLKNLTQLRELDLYSVNISSTIPQNLSSYLTMLQLSGAQLRGVLPKSVFHLFNLEDLYLPSNSLIGPIPSNVSGLQSLQSLALSSNYLNGTIPSGIFSLSSLFVLDLSHNSFSGKIQEFKSNTLVFVAVKQNQLQGPIPKSLLDQSYLLTLILSQNNFSGKIASTVCNLKILVVLDLGSNYLNGTIPQCLGEMSGLQVLDLNKNSLSGTINTSFNTESQLRIINLYGNKLKGKVPPSLINCRYLEFLDLGNNDLNDTFPSWMGGHPCLKILSLRSNKLHNHISDSRTDNLFDQIRVIDLSSNGFSGDLPVSLFENFQAMKIIGENSGTRDYNKGTGSETSSSFDYIHDYLPSIIRDLVGLRALNLSHNGLEGVIPTSLQYLAVLESLDLSSKKIGGEIPQPLVSLTSLEVLNLSHNHLVGCIPKGKQFDTFENSSYQGNDGLHGLPLSKDCGGEDGVPQVKTLVELDEEEEEGDLISWQVVLMGFGCGLVIGVSIIYIMLSTHYPVWFSRMVVKFEHRNENEKILVCNLQVFKALSVSFQKGCIGSAERHISVIVTYLLPDCAGTAAADDILQIPVSFCI
ncbi:putative poly(A) polymerase-like [Capsicum annuum]|nr:putative poly(A) polymerase-like [Capsicum annuum]